MHTYFILLNPYVQPAAAKKVLKMRIANHRFIQNGQKSTTPAYYAPLCRLTLGWCGFLDRGRLLHEQCHARLLTR